MATFCNGFPYSSRQFGQNQIIRIAQQQLGFGVVHRLVRFQGDPGSSGQIGRGNDTRALGKLREIFRRNLKAEHRLGGFQRGNGKHLAGNFKQQIIAPLKLLGGFGKRQANFSNQFDTQHCSGFQPLIFIARAW